MSSGYLTLILQGALVSLQLTLMGSALALVMAFMAGLGRLSRFFAVRALATTGGRPSSFSGRWSCRSRTRAIGTTCATQCRSIRIRRIVAGRLIHVLAQPDGSTPFVEGVEDLGNAVIELNA